MNFDKIFEKADKLYNQGNFEDAKELYQSIMLENGDTNATLMYGNCLSQLGRHEAAIKIYKKLTELDPYNEAPWYNLGCEYINLNRPAKALKYFQKAFEVDPHNADAYYKAGFCYECLNDVEQAIKHYKRSLDIEASDDALYRLGISYMVQEKEEKALECLLKTSTNDYDTNFYIGLCYDILKKPHKAIEYYNKALKLENNFNAHMNLGLCYYDIGDLVTALKHSKIAYEMEPSEPDTLRYYCHILMKAKKGSDAYNLLCSTDVDFDGDCDLLDMLIFLSLNRGDFAKADEAYVKLKKIDPNAETAFNYDEMKKKAKERSEKRKVQTDD